MAEIEFHTDAQAIDARGWLALLDGCLTTLASISRRHDPDATITILIGDVERSSLGISGVLDAPQADEVAQTFLSSIDALNAAPDIPEGLTEADVRRLQQAFAHTKKLGLSRLRVSSNGSRSWITETTRTNAKKATEGVEVSMGSVIGTIEQFDEHGKNEAHLYDYRDGRRIKVLFSEEQRTTVLDIIARRVLADVWGELHRDRAGRAQSIKAVDLDIVPERNVTVDDIYGIDPNYTGGLDSVEFVRAQRD